MKIIAFVLYSMKLYISYMYSELHYIYYEGVQSCSCVTSLIFQTALVSPTNDEYEFIVESIKERVEEGQGETIYEVGTGGEFRVLCSL